MIGILLSYHSAVIQGILPAAEHGGGGKTAACKFALFFVLLLLFKEIDVGSCELVFSPWLHIFGQNYFEMVLQFKITVCHIAIF